MPAKRSTANPLSEKIGTVRRRISLAAIRGGRNPGDIKLIAITKTVDIEQVKEAWDAGLRMFGENRVQEAQKKIAESRKWNAGSKMQWHLVGSLQKNKAKYAVQLFDLIHSLDSSALAEELNKQAGKIGKIQEVLVEIKLSPEKTKHGIPPKELIEILKTVQHNMENLRIRGLMTIPPFFEDPEKIRPYFRELRELRDKAQAEGFILPELSMGMSHDFEIAIEEGATMVRIGTALFGERISRL